MDEASVCPGSINVEIPINKDIPVMANIFKRKLVSYSSLLGALNHFSPSTVLPSVEEERSGGEKNPASLLSKLNLLMHLVRRSLA